MVLYSLKTICLLSCLSACLPVCLSACLPACLFFCLPACLPACLSVCLSACLSVCLSVCLAVILWFCFLNLTHKKLFLLHTTSWKLQTSSRALQKIEVKGCGEAMSRDKLLTYSPCITFSAPNSEPKMKYRLSTRPRENDSPKLYGISVIPREQF